MNYDDDPIIRFVWAQPVNYPGLMGQDVAARLRLGHGAGSLEEAAGDLDEKDKRPGDVLYRVTVERLDVPNDLEAPDAR